MSVRLPHRLECRGDRDSHATTPAAAKPAAQKESGRRASLTLTEEEKRQAAEVRKNALKNGSEWVPICALCTPETDRPSP